MGMSFVFTSTTANSYTANFTDMAMAAGRYAVDIDLGAELQDLKRFRIPGVRGQYVLRGGGTGRNITIVVRYIDTSVSGVEGKYSADVTAFTADSFTLAYAGSTYYGLNLDAASVHKINPIRNTGDSATAGMCFCDVAMRFTQDNPGNES
jgi:hypothetical protein